MEGFLILQSPDCIILQARHPGGQLTVAEPLQVMAAVAQFLFPSATENGSEHDDADSVFTRHPPSPQLPPTAPHLSLLLPSSFQLSKLFADETAAALIAIMQQTPVASDQSTHPCTPPQTFVPRPEALPALATYDKGHHYAFQTMTPSPCIPLQVSLVPAPVSALVPANTVTCTHHSLPARVLPELTFPSLVSLATAETLSVDHSQCSSEGLTPVPGPSVLSLGQFAVYDVEDAQSFSLPLPSEQSLSSGPAVTESADFTLLSLEGSNLHDNFHRTDGLSALTVGRIQALPTDSGSLGDRVHKWVWDHQRR